MTSKKLLFSIFQLALKPHKMVVRSQVATVEFRFDVGIKCIAELHHASIKRENLGQKFLVSKFTNLGFLSTS